MKFSTRARQAGAVVVTLAFFCGTAAADDWVAVTSSNGAFHFVAPSQPSVATSHETDDGVPYVMTMYTATTNGLAEIAAVSDYTGTDRPIDPNLLTNGFVQGVKGTLVSSAPMNYVRGANDSLPGIIATINTPNMTCRMRAAVDQPVAYMLAVCSALGVDKSADMDRVIASFAITK